MGCFAVSFCWEAEALQASQTSKRDAGMQDCAVPSRWGFSVICPWWHQQLSSTDIQRPKGAMSVCCRVYGSLRVFAVRSSVMLQVGGTSNTGSS